MHKLLLLSLMLCVPALPVAAEDAKLVTEYGFDDTLVGGDLYRPGQEVLHVRRRGPRESLIRVRESFVPELLKTVERL